MKPFWYILLRGYIHICLRVFYRRYRVIRRGPLPERGGMLVCPNHQNAFIDALIIASETRRGLFFLMRADLFKHKTAGKVLRFLRMRPIFRIRDGKDSLEKNQEVFANCLDILGKDGAYVIFPEGTHNRNRNLRPMKKGPARIALQAADEAVNPAGMRIIPASINYSDHLRFHSNVCLVYGKPIDVADYLPLYRENEALGVKALTDRIGEGIQAEMIDIQREDRAELIECLREHYCRGLWEDERLHKGQRIVAVTEGALEAQEAWIQEAEKLQKELSSRKIKPDRSLKRPFLAQLLLQSLLLLAWTPFFLLGLAGNAAGIALVRYLWKYKISDEHWNTSIAFSVGMFGFPLLYGVQALLIGLISGSGWLGLLSMPLSFLFGYLAVYVWEGWVSLAYGFYLWRAWRKDPQGMVNLEGLSQKLSLHFL